MVPKIGFLDNILTNWPDALKEKWQVLLQQAHASPHRLAQSFAVGTFICLLPIPGVDFLLATLLAVVFRQLKREVMYSALAIWNAFVVAPFYALSLQVGGFIFQSGRIPVITLAGHTSIPAQQFLLGNLVVAMAVTAVTYLVVQISANLYLARMATSR